MISDYWRSTKVSESDRYWIRAIYRYVLEMIALNTLLVFIAIGYTLWSQNGLDESRTIANDYHLATNYHYLSAMEGLRRVEGHIIFDISNTFITKHGKSTALLKGHDYNYAVELHISKREIAKGLALERLFKDGQFTILADKLNKQILSFEMNAKAYISGNSTAEGTSADINSLLITLNQLTRLHSGERFRVLNNLNKNRFQQTSAFYVLLFLLLLIGIYITVRGIRAIRVIIENQNTIKDQIKYQAHFDTLTALPNRLLSLDRLSQSLKESKRLQTKGALFFIDLDDFKKINDSLGHDFGDYHLIEVSKRLKKSIREIDTVGRLGGDEFIIILNGLNKVEDTSSVVEVILSEVKKPFIIESREIFVTCSIGICVFPDDGESVPEILRNADNAMYYAKNLGRSTFSLFTPSMNKTIVRKLAIEERMRGALERDDFSLVYQPQINISTGDLIGAEALLRWHDQKLGDVSPVEFIPIAEHTSFILEIGEFVMFEAIKQMSEWLNQSSVDFRIAINISPRQFRNKSLPDDLVRVLRQHNVPSRLLEIEITEGVLISECEHIEKALIKLDTYGINIAMDDFGTGYSSLNYLRKYPFNIIKIDRSFINDISVDEADGKLVKASIAMAHALGLKVIAEGVETEEQHYMLKTFNCDYAQGYLFGKPMKASKISEMISSCREGHRRKV